MSSDGFSCAVLAAAYLVVVVSFLRRYRQGRDDGSLAEMLRYVAVVLFSCVLVHAGDALVFSFPGRPWSWRLSVLAAVIAPLSVWKLSWLVRRADTLQGEAHARAATERERYERHLARIQALEDTFRLNSWLRQSRLALGQLTEMLARYESSSSDGPSATAETAETGIGRAK